MQNRFCIKLSKFSKEVPFLDIKYLKDSLIFSHKKAYIGQQDFIAIYWTESLQIRSLLSCINNWNTSVTADIAEQKLFTRQSKTTEFISENLKLN